MKTFSAIGRFIEIEFWRVLIFSMKLSPPRSNQSMKRAVFGLILLMGGILSSLTILKSSANPEISQKYWGINSTAISSSNQKNLETSMVILLVDRISKEGSLINSAWIAIINRSNNHVTVLPASILTKQQFNPDGNVREFINTSLQLGNMTPDYYLILDDQALDKITALTPEHQRVINYYDQSVVYQPISDPYQTHDEVASSSWEIEKKERNQNDLRLICHYLSEGISIDELSRLTTDLRDHIRSDIPIEQKLSTIEGESDIVLTYYCNLPSIRRQP